MKIAVLGPVFTESYFGGVATFDENLAIAFKKLGHDVTLVSNQKNKPKQIYGSIKVMTTKEARKKQYDIMIASLAYCRFFNKFSAKKKVYFLHGFYSFRVYGIMKTILSVLFQKHYIKYCDCVISNSSYTHNINNNMLNVKSDDYVGLGVSYDFLDALKKDRTVRGKHILYIGRVVKAKNVDQIVLALKELNKDDYVLDIVGSGCDEDEIKRLAENNGLNVVFHGRVQQEDLPKFYKSADIFISLNPSEPFGITFLEALISGCKIICPKTGGQIDFLKNYTDRVVMVDEKNPKEISLSIEKLSSVKCHNIVDVDDFSFENVAQSIINIVWGRK